MVAIKIVKAKKIYIYMYMEKHQEREMPKPLESFWSFISATTCKSLPCFLNIQKYEDRRGAEGGL